MKLNDLTNNMTKLVFNFLKENKSKSINKLKKKLLYQFEEPLEFDFYLYIRYLDTINDYKIDAYSTINKNTTEADLQLTDDIILVLELNPGNEEAIYSKLAADLKDYIRHELEHITQGPKNKLPNRPKNYSANFKGKQKYKYFLLPDEIPAMIAGMYKKAKYLKQPINIIFSNYLDEEIKKGILNNNEKNIVMKKWIEYTKIHYPSAIIEMQLKSFIKSVIIQELKISNK